jgi:tetratricopeptide (TPR) repeat protein
MTRQLFLFALVLIGSLVACAQSGNSGGQQQQQQQSIPTSKSGITIQLGKPAPQSPGPAQQSAQPGSEAAALAEADHLLASGRPAEAQAKYQAIVNADPNSVPAQVGLSRSLIIQQKLDEAQKTIDAALAIRPKSSELFLTLGDLQFAQGKIADAERSFIKAENLNPNDAGAYLALAKVYRAYSLYRRAYDNMKRAHELAPDDVAMQLLWFHSLPQIDQVPALEAYLASAKLSPRTSGALQSYLAALKRSADMPVHPCNLVSNVRETNTKLYPIARAGTELGASGVVVKINNQELHLALDTGATGVLLGRAAAERLGLQKLGYQSIVGMGESGQTGGYGALANKIRVGDLEFQDCTVRVTDKATPVTGQDGLIGTDVFSAYLIDIDIPGAKLRLSPLPKRPNEKEAPASLQTVHGDNQQFETEGPAQAAGKSSTPMLEVPKDAYVAPEMANWTKVYRFRNMLMVPTKVDNVGPLLFLLDTGSFSNTLSTQTARQLTQLRNDPSMHITGMSGSVGQVYRADKATLTFGHYQQANQDVVTFDLSNISRSAGTEVSGILGFNMLRILQTKIDYRDGLVDFIFDPKHLPKQIKMNKQ